MIKILQIVPSMGYRGVETVVMNYYRNFDMSNMQLDFATYSIVYGIKEEIEKNGGKIYHVANKNRNPLKRFNDVRKIIKENDYDIVQAHSDSASLFLDLFAAKVAGAKVRIAHSHNTNCLVRWQHDLLKPLLPFVTTNGFACSEKAGVWMFGKHPYQVITNGIDFDKYVFDEKVREEVRNEMSWNDNYIIGNVSNHQVSKNQIFLVKLLPELIKAAENIKLVFVGSFSEEAKQFIEENKLEKYVDVLGIRNDVPRLLKGFDLFGFPSLFEGNPSAVTEACAASLPCVVSEQTFDAMCDINFNDNLYHLPLDINVWVDKIEEINKQNIKRIKLTDKQIENSGFDIKVLAKELKKTYENIVSDK